jgi:hypothetical protein
MTIGIASLAVELGKETLPTLGRYARRLWVSNATLPGVARTGKQSASSFMHATVCPAQKEVYGSRPIDWLIRVDGSELDHRGPLLGFLGN